MKVFKIAVMFILTLAMITTATGANSLAQGAAYDSLSVDDIRDQSQDFSEEPLIIDFSELSEDEFALLVKGLFHHQEMKTSSNVAVNSRYIISNVSFDFRNPPHSVYADVNRTKADGIACPQIAVYNVRCEGIADCLIW